MNISIQGRNLETTSFLKQYVQKRIGQMEMFIHPLKAHFIFNRDPHHQTGLIFRAEVNLVAGGKVMRAKARAQDAYEAVDLLIPKLREQISKFKNRKATINRHARSGLKAVMTA